MLIYTETAWETKEAFVNELYTDWFNWYKDNASTIPGLTVKDGTYTLVKSSTTATWSTVDEFKALDVYVVEKTIGALAYKPVTRVNEQPVEPEVDNNYFLNTEPYRTKYRGMDAYLLNCMKEKYPAYSYAFNPTSNGKVQIFFRFHQWATKGTNIPPLDDYPVKYSRESVNLVDLVKPTTYLTYTFEDAFALPVASATNMTFDGWYLEVDYKTKVTEITEGTTGNIILYAKWIAN